MGDVDAGICNSDAHQQSESKSNNSPHDSLTELDDGYIKSRREANQANQNEEDCAVCRSQSAASRKRRLGESFRHTNVIEAEHWKALWLFSSPTIGKILSFRGGGGRGDFEHEGLPRSFLESG